MGSPSTDLISAFIGLGSNLESPVAQIKSARKTIAALNNVHELSFSSLYTSAPMGPKDQPDYVNAVMSVATGLSPLELLCGLQDIEQAHGRVRSRRWGARTLDLDLLLYGDQQIDLPELTVPHVGISDRAFVLYPLSECAPELIIPGKGKLKDLLKQCPPSGLRKLNDYESDS